MLANRLLNILPVSSVWAVSIVQYALLIIGFIGFSTLLKNRITQFFLLLLIFFPPEMFTDLLRFPIGLSYMLIGGGILSYRFYQKHTQTWYKYGALFCLLLFFVSAIWVADTAALPITLLIGVYFYTCYKNNHTLRKEIPLLIATLIGFVIGAGFIYYAKTQAPIKTGSYVALNDLSAVIQAFQKVFSNMLEVFTFQQPLWSAGIYAWFVFVFLAYVLYHTYKAGSLFRFHVLKVFFVADFILYFILLMLSSWALKNELGRWYFTGIYFTLGMFLLLLVEEFTIPSIRKSIYISFFALLIVGALTPLHAMLSIRPKNLRPMRQLASEITLLGPCGIIGDFWNAYILAVDNPSLVVATPHDKSDVRNSSLPDRVMEQPVIYVVKDMWLTTFPDTLMQFGYTLARNGDAFRAGNCELAPYQKVKTNRHFSLSDLIAEPLFLHIDSTTGKQVLRAIELNAEQYFFRTHNFMLGKGDFSLQLLSSVSDSTSQELLATLYVRSNWGSTLILEKKIYAYELAKSKLQTFSFTMLQRAEQVDVAVYYHSGADWQIEDIRLLEK